MHNEQFGEYTYSCWDVKGWSILSFNKVLSDFFVFHYSSFIVIISYNKREEDFKSEPDPLRAYNDYLEDVESISKMSEVLLCVNSSNVVEKQLPNGLHAGLA